jgi:hypothetical protein
VEQTLVLAGSDEVLLDPIKSWASSFKVCQWNERRFCSSSDWHLRQKSNPDTTLVIGINECHIAPLIWPMFGDFHETEQEIALKHWLIERLSWSKALDISLVGCYHICMVCGDTKWVNKKAMYASDSLSILIMIQTPL